MKHGPPADTRVPPPGPRGAEIVVDPETMAKVMEEKKKARDMRKERRKKEREKLQLELAEAERRAMEAKEARDQERQRREEELRDRLEHLRERKAQRELEFLVSEKRAQQVRASKSLADVIEEQFQQKLAEEEAERQRRLQERREKLHAPVLTGIEAIQRHFKLVEERKKRKEEELRQRREEIAKLPMPERYHGHSYENAIEDYVKFKNGENDLRHQRLYKHAKMQEYGNLVKRLYMPAPAPIHGDFGDPPHPTPASIGLDSEARRRSPPPFVTGAHPPATKRRCLSRTKEGKPGPNRTQ